MDKTMGSWRPCNSKIRLWFFFCSILIFGLGSWGAVHRILGVEYQVFSCVRKHLLPFKATLPFFLHRSGGYRLWRKSPQFKHRSVSGDPCRLTKFLLSSLPLKTPAHASVVVMHPQSEVQSVKITRSSPDTSNAVTSPIIPSLESQVVRKPAIPLVYHPFYELQGFSENHRFKMWKFPLLRRFLETSKVAEASQFFTPSTDMEAIRKLLLLVHCPSYVSRCLDGSLDEKRQRKIGLPFSPSLVKRFCIEVRQVAGSVLTTRLALHHGIACNLGGGTHHAMKDFGQGFTIFNDLVIAAQAMLQEKRVKKIVVVDLDVHQGDGTAALCKDKKEIFTLSFHCEDNFPFKKETSDLDISFPGGTGDKVYLKMLRKIFPRVLQEEKPGLLLYQAGVDCWKGDVLGKLNLSHQGLYWRDFFVIQECLRANIPIACFMGGGYDENRTALVKRHAILHRASKDAYSKYAHPTG